MQQWYNINDEEFEKLTRHITTLDLVRSVPLFYAENHPVSKLNVLRYLDDHGADADAKHYFIWRAVFNSMCAGDKADVLRYIEWLNNGDCEENDEG